ncbi:MAG: ABC transporter ATP-binding protein [Candidatus Methylomirabilis oxygeniifera]|uniref:Putative ABC transporter (Permease and ATP-binding protein) n=1 Tax=Methylomirabilis oxygeniifera TaxID=671143 RepID=D5MJ02_METO1|nr:MAG: ABC transporter ATP-binding protein [Candidatus Methylomirabilis oxyfera]CBE67367.1 Putative ABC transporter (permease and ATP-binding protein) [Candidatus Methylomirabilis oxyfera]
MQTPLQQFLRVLRCAAPYRARVILAVVSLILIAVLNAVSIGSLQPIFDGLFAAEGIGSGISLPDPIMTLLGHRLVRFQAFLQAHRISTLTFIGGALFFVFVAKGALIYIQQLQLRYVAEGIQRDIRNDLYTHLHALSLGFFTRRSTGEIMSRLSSDVESLGDASTELFRNALREPFNIVGLIVLLFLIKWQLAILSLLVLPVALLPIVKFGSKIRRRGTLVQEGRAELNTILQETISGVRIVKAFGMEEYERRRYRHASEQLFKAVMRIAKVDALTSPVLEVLGSVGIVVAIWVGGYLVFSKSLTPGAFMAFLGALASLYQPVKRISQINNNIQRGMAGAARVFEIMDLRPDLVEQPGAATLGRMQEGIRFHNVSFAYGSERTVLRGISFGAKLGEIVAVVGSSGAGKSTMVNLIPRFYDPTEGVITIDGVDIARATLSSLRAQMGIVTQDTILFDDTILNNIAYGQRDVASDLVVEAARIANADEFIEALPERYETRIGERGVRLSGGEKQRIAIARAILKNPPILILDEATSALDAESERLVQEALDRLMQNRTTFVIAHRLSTVIRADKILVLDAGSCVEQGTHPELMALGGVYCRLYNTQRAHA